MVSSARSALYWRSDRSQISVYSFSGIASFKNAFSSSSSVTMMLKSSASDSWRSRSARVSVSLTSCGVRESTMLMSDEFFFFFSVGYSQRTSSRLMVAENVELGT